LHPLDRDDEAYYPGVKPQRGQNGAQQKDLRPKQNGHVQTAPNNGINGVAGSTFD
jgi:hypothetical protein